jgi:hypothetical protein
MESSKNYSSDIEYRKETITPLKKINDSEFCLNTKRINIMTPSNNK